jgi:photosystem II stability/assembly factor-like uncharacterized protein
MYLKHCSFYNIHAVILAVLLFACSASEKERTNNAEINTKSNGRNDDWSVVGAGGGGALFNPAISPHNFNLVFVSCDMTGSYVTENGGDSWRMFNLRGVTHFYAFDPNEPNVVYANSSALFRSKDFGKTWNVIYPGPSEITGIVSKGDHAMEVVVTKDSTRRNVLALTVDPTDSKKLYAAIAIDKEAGFFFSEDRGERWTKERVLDDGAKKIFIDPSSPVDSRTIYVAGKNTVSVKRNGVWNVNKAPDGIKKITEFSGGFDKEQNKFFIYAIAGKGYFNQQGDPSGIYCTEDGGATWQNRQQGLLSFQIANADMPEYRAVATSANHPNVIYVSYNNLRVHRDTTCIGVARSDDYGVTWTLSWKDRISSNHVQVPSPNMKDGWLNERFGPSWGENPFSIAVDPNNPNVCYGTDFGRTIKSTDGGKAWQQVYTKKIGSGWSSRGLDVTTSYQIAFDPFNPNHGFIATTDIGLMESNDCGRAWNSATKENGIPRKWENSTYWVVMDPKVKNKIWAAMSGTHDLPRPKMWRHKRVSDFMGGIVASEDGGKSWEPVSADLGESAVTHLLLDSASDPTSRVLYACSFGKGVFKSIDGGKTWKKKNKGLPEDEPFAWRMEKRSTDGALFLVVARRNDDGSIGNKQDGALYKSSDGAETWSKVTLPEGTNGPMSLKVDPQNPETLILSAWGREVHDRFTQDVGGGIFRSTDSGKSWDHVLKSDQHIHDITYDARSAVFYACGFNGSAYRSDDRGKSWQRIKGYNFKWGKRVELDPRNPEKIFIITFGGGVWHGPAKGDQNAIEDIISDVIAYH